MDIKRKKELLDIYKNTRFQMGVVKIECLITQDRFYDISTNIKATINSNIAKLRFNSHPNKELSRLWHEYTEKDFEFSCVKEYNYKNVDDDHQEKLEKLRDEILLNDMKGRKVWK